MSRRRAAAAVATAVLGLAGCAGTEHSPASTEARSVDAMRIGLTEWSVVVPRGPLRPGRVRLEVTNAGATTHDLVVTGQRGSWQTPLLAPGERSALVVEAVAGEMLHLDCRVPGHHSTGMHEQVPVAPTGSGEP